MKRKTLCQRKVKTMALAVGTNSYISRADADTYFSDAIHADTWRDASNTNKDRALVTAYRMLDRQEWKGSKTDPVTPQAQDWPRTGLSDPEGTPIADDSVPQFILDAQSELALSILNDPAVQTSADTGSNIRSVGAGSARIEFFVGTAGSEPRFPTIVNELIRYYLEGSSTLEAPYAGGTDNESGITNYPLTRGY
jgi:hypothetical protein